MKRVLLAVGLVGAGAAVAAWAYDRQMVEEWAEAAARAGLRAWEGVEANPGPVILALATFAATVVYHKVRGKSLREAVEVAATRVQVVNLPRPPDQAEEPTVLRRAKARATRAQLVADQIGLQNRLRKLPDAVTKAEKEACYAEQSVADAERVLADRRAAHAAAAEALDALRAELAAGRADLAAMDAELQKLAETV